MPKARTCDIVAKRKRRYRQSSGANRRMMAIVRAYQKGDAAASIGRRFGISANAVYQTIGRLRRKLEDAAQNMDGGMDILCQADKSIPAPGLDQIIKRFNLLKKHQGEADQAAALMLARAENRKR